MAARVVVSTECPTCGAPLDFGEGTNALRCVHCRSNLLVTGRKQVLSYTIAPKVPPSLAVQIARFAEPAAAGRFRIEDPELCFIPYYRLSGHEFRWMRETVRPEPAAAIPFRPMGENSAAGVDFSSLSLAFGAEREEVRFRDRHVERNFLGCDLERLGPYSLGVRPTVLRLELFRGRDLEARGRVVAPDLDPAAALAHGLRSAEAHRVLYRTVIGTILSIVYFPFWILTIERRGRGTLTILDAVSEKVLGRDLPVDLRDRLRRPPPTEPAVLGFRPLVCPNCGWDLPVRAEDVIFFCAACKRAWRLEGDRLLDTRHAVVAGEAGRGRFRNLPFWILDAELPSGPRRLFLPAFRYRRLKILNDLASTLARRQPAYAPAAEAAGDLHGGYFDAADAGELARFVAAGLDSPDVATLASFRPESVRTGEPTLTWIPFRVEPHSLIEPATGMAIPSGLLI